MQKAKKLAIGPINEYKTKIATKLLNNADTWLGLNESHIKTLQNFQDHFITKVFQVSARGTPKGMLWLDSQTLKMKWRIIKLKLRAIAKTIGKCTDNLCRQALIAGQETFDCQDLLTECMNICKNLGVKCLSHGVPNAKEQ